MWYITLKPLTGSNSAREFEPSGALREARTGYAQCFRQPPLQGGQGGLAPLVLRRQALAPPGRYKENCRNASILEGLGF